MAAQSLLGYFEQSCTLFNLTGWEGGALNNRAGECLLSIGRDYVQTLAPPLRGEWEGNGDRRQSTANEVAKFIDREAQWSILGTKRAIHKDFKTRKRCHSKPLREQIRKAPITTHFRSVNGTAQPYHLHSRPQTITF